MAGYLLLLVLALILPARATELEQAQVCTPQVTVLDNGLCMRAPPPGTGLDAQGRGWVHCMEPGLYLFYGAAVNGQTAPRVVWCGYNEAGTTGCCLMIQQLNSRMEWVRLGGNRRREPIPTSALYPPM